MTTTLAPQDPAELAECLRSARGPVRLHGLGSQRERLPAPVPAATIVSLARLQAVERLDAADQTCSVQVGVRRHDLDAALAERGVELPCPGGGTIGGLFASDPLGAATQGGPQPRTLLLGIEALLADGTAFRSGARVVKSVAGFDVHKLLVGSRGRLFAATLLHLRLRPRPRAEAWFANERLEQTAALALFASLRLSASPPALLRLSRDAAGFTVAGRLAGHGRAVAAQQSAFALREGPPLAELHLAPPAGGEIVAGALLHGRLPRLLAILPPGAPFAVLGGGRFEAALPDERSADAVLAALPDLGAHGCLASGSDERRGRATPLDPGAERLTALLKAALDPHGRLV